VLAPSILSASSPALTDRNQQKSGPALRIVVIEGEGAVNIIQQKTAVAPMIEVRDRNDQPVAGATVNFVVRAGRATFGGARTLTVTTNAAGRAAAAGFAPSGTGALQIGATATFQGQTAAVAIAQTNVMTAAEAAAVSSAGAGGAGGSGGAGSAAGGGAGARWWRAIRDDDRHCWRSRCRRRRGGAASAVVRNDLHRPVQWSDAGH